ncbi:MAG: peptidylprolyl isomerase [Myxococcota bacterium]
MRLCLTLLPLLLLSLAACGGAQRFDDALSPDRLQAARQGEVAGPADVSPTQLPADLRQAVDELTRAAQSGTLPPNDEWLSSKAIRIQAKKGDQDHSPVTAQQLAEWLALAPARIVRNGNTVTFTLPDAKPPMALYWYREEAGWRLDPLYTPPYAEADAGDKVPENTPISLQQALDGLPGQGARVEATLLTSGGELKCVLHPEAAPRTVANFVGLARGLRAFKDGAKSTDPKAGVWRKRPFFEGLTFHRIVPGFVIQGGDPEGSGEGGPGYALVDEFSPQLRFDQSGALGMANGGPNTNGSQFFITEAPTTWLNDRYSIFGRCEPLALVRELSSAPTLATEPSRPTDPVRILTVTFRRVP